MFDGELVVAIDMGSSMIRVAIGEYNQEGQLQLAGFAQKPAQLLRKGVIGNVELMTKLINQVVEEAEYDAGRTVEELWVGLSAQTLDSLNSRGVVVIQSKDREIGPQDVKRVLEVSRAIAMPMDREILHVIPQHYSVDEQQGIKDPCDMMGLRLGAEVHLVTAPLAATDNSLKAVNRAGFRVNSLVMDSLAAAQAVLTKEEMEMGVLLIDMGMSSTNWMILQGGAPWKSGHLPLGGEQVSKDISIVLKTPMESAEDIKLEAGCCWQDLLEEDEPVIVPGVGGREPAHVSRRELSMIIESRMAEVFRIIMEDMDLGKNIYRLGGGVVICGGASQMMGITELASEVFDLPVRRGLPLGPVIGLEGKNTADLAVLMGLLLYGDLHREGQAKDKKKQKISLGGGASKKEKNTAGAIWSWLKEFV